LRMPLTTSSITRGMDAMGSHCPTPEPRLQHRLRRLPGTAGPRDGDDPLGPDHGGMVVQEEQDRSLLPHEAAAEQGEEAKPCLQRCTDRGLQVTAAV
jgi:hypothetical protein